MDPKLQGWYNMCLHKKRFSYELAQMMAKRWNQRAYLCPHCNGYHLTKQLVPSVSITRPSHSKETRVILDKRVKAKVVHFLTNKVFWHIYTYKALLQVLNLLGASRVANKNKALNVLCWNTSWTKQSDTVLSNIYNLVKGKHTDYLDFSLTSSKKACKV
jgi:hypothetical protein